MFWVLLATFVTASIEHVVDGDTFDVAHERIRISNIDAPETDGRAKCETERKLGDLAKDRLTALLSHGGVTIERQGQDRFKRTLALVRVNGDDVGITLITERLAVPWEGRQHRWCD